MSPLSAGEYSSEYSFVPQNTREWSHTQKWPYSIVDALHNELHTEGAFSLSRFLKNRKFANVLLGVKKK